MSTLLLLLLAIAPPAVLMFMIYWMDKHETESLKNVILAMAIGAISIVPAIIIEISFESLPLFTLPGLAGGFYESFLLTAPTEELVKFLFIYLFIRKKPFYNASYDGIVYYGAGALGFALLENIFYVFDNGFPTGVLRAFTSIPIHAFCGIIIGYHIGLARFIYPYKPKRLIFTGLFLAYLTHALYNTLASADSLLTLLFIPMVAVIYFAIYNVLHRGIQLSTASDQTTQSGVFAAVSPVIPSRGLSSARPVENYRLADVVIDSDGRKYLVQKKEKWKAWISRILIISTGLLWVLVFYAGDTPPAEMLDLVMGMILLTIIPFMIGLLLELSYQRRKRRKIYIDVLVN